MIRLRQHHWALAFAIALLVHLAAYLYAIGLPGSEPVYRGGGTFNQDGEQTDSTAGVFVQLGTSGESQGDEPVQAAPQEQAPDEKPNNPWPKRMSPARTNRDRIPRQRRHRNPLNRRSRSASARPNQRKTRQRRKPARRPWKWMSWRSPRPR